MDIAAMERSELSSNSRLRCRRYGLLGSPRSCSSLSAATSRSSSHAGLPYWWLRLYSTCGESPHSYRKLTTGSLSKHQSLAEPRPMVLHSLPCTVGIQSSVREQRQLVGL